MCGRTCEPSPSVNRPPVTVCKSQPTFASVIGVRANAIATAVPSSIDVVCSPATAIGTKGSCFAWNEKARSYPMSSNVR